ncbi:MAG TPA: zinc-ribbon domain-containing protein [Anaerolineae bacterium]
MADSTHFDQSGKSEFITDADRLAKAQKGPDINCPYCGTRNAADATQCSHCGGDLTGAAKRSSGEVIGAFQAGPQPDIKCPSCGTMNPAGSHKCTNCGSPLTDSAAQKKPVPVPVKPKGIGIIPIVLIGIVIIACLALFTLSTRTSDAVGNVRSVSWQRTVGVMKPQPVNHEGWRDQDPAGASLGTCKPAVKSQQDTPTANSQKVCGTPYTINQGNGTGKVVQNCVYQIMADYCSYSTIEWMRVDAVVAKGTDFNPQWPTVDTNASQRPGVRDETYQVVFAAGDKTYSYAPQTQQDYMRFTVGSKWKLTVNALGIVTKVEPA